MGDAERKIAERLSRADDAFAACGKYLRRLGFTDLEIADAMLITASAFMQHARGTAWCAKRFRIIAYGLERTAAAEGKPGEPAKPN